MWDNEYYVQWSKRHSIAVSNLIVYCEYKLLGICQLVFVAGRPHTV